MVFLFMQIVLIIWIWLFHGSRHRSSLNILRNGEPYTSGLTYRFHVFTSSTTF